MLCLAIRAPLPAQLLLGQASAISLGRESSNFSSLHWQLLLASVSGLKELKNCWGGREGGAVKSAFLALCLFDSSSHIPSLAERVVAANFEALNTELLPSDKVRCAASLNAKFGCTFRMFLVFFTPGGRDNCRFYFGRQFFLLLLSLPVIPF